MDAEGLSRSLQQVTSSAWRLETLQYYAGEDDEVEDFRNGRPRAERSVTTSPYLRRLAAAALEGRSWARVHVVDHPLTDYLLYELGAYVESAAVGESIRIANRSASPALGGLRQDFWLIDEATPSAAALLMDYDAAGRFQGARKAADAGTLEWCRSVKDLVLRYAVPLNAYLAAMRGRQQVA
jgi:hypothetical protein